MKKLHTVLPPASDTKFVGHEPTWFDVEITDKNYVKEMMRGLNWHNYVAKDSDFHKYLIQWVSKHQVDALKKIEGLNSSEVTPTVATIARMHLQGFPLKDRHIQSITDHIAVLLTPKKKEPKPITQPKVVPDVQQAMRSQVSSTLSDIEEQIDLAFDKFEIDPPKIADLILKKQYTHKHLQIISKEIDKNIQEWTAAYDKTDEQLSQGYGYIPRRKFRQIIDGFTDVVQKIQQFVDNTKVARKPRPINKAVVTKNLKFLPTFEQYTGQPTTSVVGATILWIYDTKYRKLIKLTGEKKGLSAKGASITGVTKAQVKMLRWPEKQLVEFTVSKGKATTDWFDKLTTKEAEASHRITPTMILLRVE